MEHTTDYSVKNKCVAILIWLSLGLVNLIYFWENGEKLINSDSASEMILAKVLNSTKSFITDEWYYSTELRVLNTQVIYRIFIWLFPHNWHLARFFSVMVFILILSFSAYFLFSQIYGWDSIEGILAAAIVICPFSQWYGWNVIYDSYYVPHIAISLMQLGLFIGFMQRHHAQKLIFLIFGVVLAFVSGLGGVRQLMITHAPLLLASIIIAIYNWKKDRAECDGLIKNVLCSAVICLSAGFGYVINSRIFAQRYSFESMGNVEWDEFSASSVIRQLGEVIGLFGWQSGAKITSAYSMSNMGCLLIAGTISISMFTLYRNYEKLKMAERVLYVFSMSSFAILMLLYSQSSRANRSYWVPLLPFFLFLIILSSKNTKMNIKNVFLGIALVLSLITCSIATMSNPYPKNPDVPTDLDIIEVERWIDEMGYTHGYATFWQSNILTELSDGDIDMYPIDNFREFEPRKWLERKTFVENPAVSDVFILFTIDEWNEAVQKHEKLAEHMVYGTDKYTILYYSDLSQFTMLIQSAF